MLNLESCIDRVIDVMREHAELMQRAINEPDNKAELTELLQQSSDRSIALDIECDSDSEEAKMYMKDHLEVADNIFEMIGRATTLELKLKYRLDENIAEDARLFKVVDLWGDHNPSADNIE